MFYGKGGNVTSSLAVGWFLHMFKIVGKMDILYFVLSLIHCRFIGLKLSSLNGSSDNFVAMWYQWQQDKAEGDWERLIGAFSPGHLCYSRRWETAMMIKEGEIRN